MEIKYKGFIAEVFFFPEASSFCGEVWNAVDLITFQASNPQDAFEAMQESVERYLRHTSLNVAAEIRNAHEITSSFERELFERSEFSERKKRKLFRARS